MAFGNEPVKFHCPMDQISKEDKDVIEDLFYLLFSNADFAYTLLGVKPMCDISYTMHYAQSISSNDRYIRETFLARKGFNTWQKYQQLFPMKKLRLVLRSSNKFGERVSFILINPSLCLPIIEKHLYLFQKYYGFKLSVEQILKLICEDKFFRSDEMDSEIFGLLLGYPEKDVKSFHRRTILEKAKSILPIDVRANRNQFFCKISNLDLMHLNSITSGTITPDLNQLSKARRPFRLVLKNPLYPFTTPIFIAFRDECEELNYIREKYESIKSDLIKFYYADNFLENLLERLS